VSGFHTPARPSWICPQDGESWPCELARKQLAEIFLGSEDRLSAQMARLMGVAAHDLGLPDSSKLYRRFVRWTVDGAMLQCGRCGRSGHQALPGLPPRLFPCDLKHGGQP
jgi:hypothetical protein